MKTMKRMKIQLFVVSICVIFGLSVLMGSAVARPIEPLTYDYAEFRNDPYPKGTNTMTIYYFHESYCNMYIYLYNPNDYKVKTWLVDRYDRSGYFYNTGSIDGVWRLQCYMSGYQPYWTDAALFHTFSISDPEPEQGNLGEDWARHPQNQDIYEQALTIIGQAASSYTAAQKIYSHVVSHLVHDYTDITFRSDLDLLNDLNTYDHYYGVCRSDAVILTAYARTLGIPARIIHLHAVWPPHGIQPPNNPDEHYFAEFYVRYCGSYQWVPVDGDPEYDWFGIYEANWRISELWQEEMWIGGRRYGWTISIEIVTTIPHEGIVDDGYDTDDYPNHPYRNDL